LLAVRTLRFARVRADTPNHGPLGLELLGLSAERVRQIEEPGLAKVGEGS
jgi:DNA-directed RNA polymerase sigma subunit (sigma70/sigma32)